MIFVIVTKRHKERVLRNELLSLLDIERLGNHASKKQISVIKFEVNSINYLRF